MSFPSGKIDAMGKTERRRGQIVSIGYEGRSAAELVELLDHERVQFVVDVRQNPISRKPGLSGSALADALAERGIEYRHEPMLGNPRSNREGFRNGEGYARRRFIKRLENGSRAALDEVVALAGSHVIALLCFERAHLQCHRSAITDKAQAGHPGLRIVTI